MVCLKPAEDGSQRSEDRGQRTEDRSQKSEDRRQKTEKGNLVVCMGMDYFRQRDMENDLINSARRLILLLSEKGLTLSIAESCTGGLVCHAITSIPGASKVFHSGIVSYSRDSKLRLIGVDEKIIDAHGTISEETARAMAENIRIKTGTDLSLSTTGNLGPEAMEGKDVGLVYFAVSHKNGVTVRKRLFQRDRYFNKYDAAMEGINLIVEVISKDI